ncbi:uncharacterized protein A1O5_09810 [Cladophialophora psammophila CBS 110553]|uniref:CST complex subunit Stn1 N-terminal domain-containing protein n=1 Tax=Cladophialophora psammophila CBS 110553 TaxID=1182543 RepID=W9WGW1_9EURO|nr:uncharacterized protein A1O5_09810 [Cladophialophora psammophila CBS 110553]EXJ67163.1 hypothetical protein A1O5_09810 [Cladophialophora psammophila CBS 110553]
MTEGAPNGPVPSRLVFIHEIPSLPAASKVRLLGCIVQYDAIKGQILVEHAYPRSASPIPRLWVDINLVLENAKPTLLEPGTWINAIGYTRSSGWQTGKKSGKKPQDLYETVFLQAVLIWDATAVRIEDYEDILEEQRRVRRQLVSNRNSSQNDFQTALNMRHRQEDAAPIDTYFEV